MARNKGLAPNIDNSNLAAYPNGRIKDNTGSGNGTPVNEFVYGDIHEAFAKAMRLYGIDFTGLPDNETNGYQYIDALRALASKNNIVQPLTVASGVLNIPVKIGFMLTNEELIVKSSFDLGSETQIKGSDNVTLNFTAIGNFKTDEYLRVIKLASSILIVRLVDAVNLNAAVAELLYLKKASQAQEDAGTSDTVATTPLVNKTTFTKRVIGADSTPFLATTTNNGLLSAADKAIIDGIGSSPVKNIGWVSGIDIGSGTPGSPYAKSGDIAAAVCNAVGGNATVIEVTLANAMANTNYFVRMHVQSESANIQNDNEVTAPVFRVISTTQFLFSMTDIGPLTQSLKVHIEAYQL